MADDLVRLARQHLDEDERAALSGWQGPWTLKRDNALFGPVACIMMPLPPHPDASTGLTSYTPIGTQDAETLEHIVRHDPARVLRAVAAKRRVVDAYAEALHIQAKAGIREYGHEEATREALELAVRAIVDEYEPAKATDGR